MSSFSFIELLYFFLLTIFAPCALGIVFYGLVLRGGTCSFSHDLSISSPFRWFLPTPSPEPGFFFGWHQAPQWQGYWRYRRCRHGPSLLCWAPLPSPAPTGRLSAYSMTATGATRSCLSLVGKSHTSVTSQVVNLVWFPSTNGVWLVPITLERDSSLPPFLSFCTGWFSSYSTSWWERNVKTSSCDYGIISSLILSICISFVLKRLPMHTHLWVDLCLRVFVQSIILPFKIV